MILLLHLAFFLSGLAALLFEALWFYQAGLGLGNSLWASSLVLAAFMGGLGVGNGLVGRLGHRIRRPVRLYALLELVIGISGVSIVYLLPVITPWLVPIFQPFLDATYGLNALRLGVSFLVLLVPASAMGATMPLLVSALYRRDPRFGAVLGRLYGWNTLGAVVGAVIGDAFLIAWLGIHGAAATAAIVNCTAALLAIAMAKRLEEEASGATLNDGGVERDPVRLSNRARSLLLAAALSGATLLALEVVWYRFLLLWVSGSSIAFAAMLAVVLSGIGLGGLFASGWLARNPNAHFHLPGLIATSGALCVGVYAGFEFVPNLTGVQGAAGFSMTLALAVPLMFPVSFMSGVIFTFLGEALNLEAPAETQSAGFLTLANTVGAMLGSLGAGFLLLPGLGIERSIFCLSLSYGLVMLAALFGSDRAKWSSRKTSLSMGCALLLAALVLFPHGLMKQNYVHTPIRHYSIGSTNAHETQLVAIREGLTETLMYLRHLAFGETTAYRLITNSHSMSGTHPRSTRYMKLFVYWPVAVHPDPKSALLISYGVGGTAKALTDTKALERIDIVDISRDILEMNRVVYRDHAEHPLADPRVRVHIEDGRYFLQTTRHRFDIITGEPPPPTMAGVVSLYTREYFELLMDRLSEGGIATYWLPTHSLGVHDAQVISRAFCDVFEDCTLWGGSGYDYMLVGSRNATGPVSAEHFSKQWRDPVVGPELRDLGFELPEQLAALFMGGRETLLELSGDAKPLTDNFPKRLSDVPLQNFEAFRNWNDGRSAKREFRRDPTVARLFPEEIIRGAIEYFDDQFEIQRALMRHVDYVEKFPVVHRWLDETNLVAAPLFLLATTPGHNKAIERAWENGSRAPGIHYFHGVSALVARDYESAAIRFRKTPTTSEYGLLSRIYEVYALAMADRCEESHSRLKEFWLNGESDPILYKIDEFIRQRCRDRARGENVSTLVVD